MSKDLVRIVLLGRMNERDSGVVGKIVALSVLVMSLGAAFALILASSS